MIKETIYLAIITIQFRIFFLKRVVGNNISWIKIMCLVFKYIDTEKINVIYKQSKRHDCILNSMLPCLIFHTRVLFALLAISTDH